MSIDRLSRPVHPLRSLRAAFVVAVALPVSAFLVAPSAAGLPPQDEGSTSRPSDDGSTGDLERADMTAGHLLEVGRALSAWSRDTRLERGGQRSRRARGAARVEEQRWERCPSISWAELAELLVPAYLRELPREDGWGRPLEFCLDRRLVAARQSYGVRSAGSDGEFEADPYRVGSFPDSRLASDLVWMDGSFVRWHEPQ